MNFKIRRHFRWPDQTVGFLLSGQTNDGGMTLIEGLVAIAIIGITISVMSPLVILSVGTRVQSQRAEQAFQLAQAEVDRIKLIVDRGGDYTLNIASTANTVVGTADFGAVPAPQNIHSTHYTTNLLSTKGIDVDNDGDNDFALQIFKTEGIANGTRPVAFDLGVRVYRADVVGVGKTLGVDEAALNMTSGEGQSGTAPLATLYTSVIKGDATNSLCDYHNFVNSVNGTTVAKPSDC